MTHLYVNHRVKDFNKYYDIFRFHYKIKIEKVKVLFMLPISTK